MRLIDFIRKSSDEELRAFIRKEARVNGYTPFTELIENANYWDCPGECKYLEKDLLDEWNCTLENCDECPFGIDYEEAYTNQIMKWFNQDISV